MPFDQTLPHFRPIRTLVHSSAGPLTQTVKQGGFDVGSLAASGIDEGRWSMYLPLVGETSKPHIVIDELKQLVRKLHSNGWHN
jgi:hypothetical protein